MTRQTIAIPAGDLGEALTRRLREKPAPSEKVMVTVETVPDYTEIPPGYFGKPAPRHSRTNEIGRLR